MARDEGNEIKSGWGMKESCGFLIRYKTCKFYFSVMFCELSKMSLVCCFRVSSSSSQDITKDLDVLHPAAESMTEYSTHSSSDDDSSNKQDPHQMLDSSTDLSVPNTPSVVLREEPLIEELADPALVDKKTIDMKSLIVEDQRQDEDCSPAISFDASTPMITCQVTSDLRAPDTDGPPISSDIMLVKNSEHASVHLTPNALHRQTSGSVCSIHVSFPGVLLSNSQTIWFCTPSAAEEN